MRSKWLSSLINRRPASWRNGAAVKHSRLQLEALEDRRLLSLSVGNLVWNDANANGIQDTGEAGAAGAVVELFRSTDATVGNADDISIGQAATDTSGHYEFSGLTESTNYFLKVRPPVGFSFTTPGAGDDRALDSDVDPSGATAMFTLAPGTDRTDLDAGLAGAAPSFGFAFSAGNSTANMSAQKMTVDGAGNIYIAATIKGTVDFDPGPGVYNVATSGSSSSLILAKYTSAGALCWTRMVGGNYFNSLAAAADGSVYFTGYYSSSFDFDPGPGVINLTYAGGNADMYLAKLDASGNIAWAYGIGGTGYEVGRGIAIAPDGNLIVTGSSQNTVDFDPGAGVTSIISAGYSDIFIAKYGPAGNLIWVDRFGGTSSDDGYDIAPAADGSIYATGNFYGTVDFDPGTGVTNLTSTHGAVFILKLTSAGALIWADGISGTDNVNPYSIAVGPDGGAVTTGSFNGTIDFDPGSGTYNLTGPYSGSETFISKVNADGSFAWVRASASINVKDAAVASDNSVFATGGYSGTVDFNLSVDQTFNLSGGGGFVWKLDASGNFSMAAGFGTSNTSVNALATFPDGSAGVYGSFSNTMDVDPRGGVRTLNAGSYADIYFLKLSPDAAPTDITLGPATVPKNARRGSLVGGLSAADPDPGESFTYEMLDSVGGRFMLDGAQVRVANTALISQPADYSIKVRVRDSLGTLFDKTLTITVTNDPTSSVGDRVWNDLNGNGILDAGEPGVAAAVVEMLQSTDAISGNADDFSLGTTITSATGNYSFSGVLPGANYYLVFHAPVGYSFAPQDAGSDDTIDSDADSTGVTVMFSLTGQSLTDLDAGMTGLGPAFGFALPLGGLDNDFGKSVAVDSAGNVYVVGTFTDAIDFDSGPGVYNLSNVKSGYADLFVAKYSKTGALCWARNLGGTSNTEIYNFAFDAGGNIATTATFEGTQDFDPGLGAFYMTAVNGSSPFVWKLDANGIFVSAIQIAVNCPGNLESLVTTADGSTYITGGFSGTVDFDPGPNTVELTSPYGYSDVFVAKFNSTGNLVWARSMGGPSHDYGTAIAVSSDGLSIYVTGSFFRWASFGSFSLYTENFSSSWFTDAFVEKLDSAGNVIWAKNLGGRMDDIGTGIAIGADGIYTTGTSMGIADFDPSAATHVIGDDQSSSRRLFVSKLDISGNYLQAVGLPGGDAIGGGIALDSSRNVYLTGSFGGTTDFDPRGGEYNVSSSGNWNAFVARLNVDSAPTSIAFTPAVVPPTIALGDVVGELSAVDADANERFTFELTSSTSGLFTITDSLIRVASKTVAAGSYNVGVRVRDTFGASYTKTVVVTVNTSDPRCSVSGQVWDDLNANGMQDAGEPGIAGAVVEAVRSRDAIPDNGDDFSWSVAVADSSGNFVLDGLASGVNYSLIFRPPVSYVFTFPNVGGDESFDSDANSLGVTSLFTLASGETRTDIDAGMTGAAPGSGFAVSIQNPSYYDPAEGKVLAVDALGNIYAGGNLPNYSDFDPGPRETPLASYGAYLAKYTAAGALCWVRTLRGNSQIQAIALAADGGIIAAGGFAETADFDPGQNANNLTSSWSSWDIFITKYDTLGNPLWVRQMGDIEGESVTGLVLDAGGNIYAAGHFAGAVDFDPGPITRRYTSFGYNLNNGIWTSDIFVLKLDSNGNYNASTSWLKQMGGVGEDIAYGLALGPDGSIVTTGYFSGTADFDPSSTTRNLVSYGAQDIFISKLNASGSYVWARQIGQSLNDIGYAVAVAADGSVYTTGKFRGITDFDPGPGIANLICEGGGNEDIFVLKLDSAGNYVWAHNFGGSDFDSGNAIALGPNGSVTVTGNFIGAADFDPGPGTFRLVNSLSKGVFVLNLDAAGNLGWAGCFSGCHEGLAVAVGPTGDVYTTGSFAGTVDFDPGSGVYNLVDTSGYQDVFLAMFYAPQAPTALALSNYQVPEHSRNGAVVGQFLASDPNPGETFTYELLDSADGRFKISGAVLQVADGSRLDHDQNASHQVTVRVFDSLGSALTLTFTVEVTQEPLGSLGDRVWNDLNSDGIQDPGEPGVPGAVVELFQSYDAIVGNDDDVSLGQTVTNAQGLYQLDGLSGNGRYFLLVRPPVGFTSFSPQDAGTIEAADSDADSVGFTTIWTPAPGARHTDLDIGLVGDLPNFGFALRLGGTSTDTGDSTAMDAEGNIYVAGDFTGTVDFDSGPGVYQLTSTTNSEYTGVFVAKYSSTGALYWARNFGGRTDMCRFGVDVATDGSVYINGTFSHVVDFDPGPGEYLVSPSTDGGSDIFVLKLDAEGDFAWVRTRNGATLSIVNGLAATLDNGVVTTGKLGEVGLIWKLDSQGNEAWSRIFSDYCSPLTPTTDSSGNVFVSGYFQGTVDFDPGSGTYNLSSQGDYDAFVLKLNAAGEFQWARRMGGSGTDYGWSVALAPDSSVYVAGQFVGTVDFDPGSGIYNVTCAGSVDAFLTKLDADGNFVWVRTLGATSASCSARGVAVSPQGDVCATGNFSRTVDFDPGAAVFNLSTSGSSAFVWRLTPAGDFDAAFGLGINSGGTRIAVGSDQSIYSMGTFSGTGDFDPGINAFNMTSLSTDIFLWKLRINNPPQAQPGGLYRMSPGESLVLSGVASTDPDAPAGDRIVSYEWDLGDDGTYEFSGVSPTVAWAELAGLPLNTDNPLRLRVTDRSGATDSAATVLRIESPPPVVSGIIVGDDSAQRSMVTSLTVVFSTLVNIDEEAFEVLALDAGEAAVTITATISQVGGCTQATLQFSGSQTDHASLIDGNYQLIIHGDKVHDAAYGIALDGDGDGQPGGDYLFGNHLFDGFFRFFGDSDGDRDVDNLDFARFRNSYNKLAGDSAYVASFDGNTDGAVNSLDFNAFRVNYLTRLATSLPSAGSADLTLTMGDDGLVHVYQTGTTIDAALPRMSAASSTSGIPGQLLLCDTLTVDFGRGNPIDVNGVSFSGNAIRIVGTSSNDEVTITDSNIVCNGSAPLYFANASNFAFDLGSGENSLTISGTTLVVQQDNAISAGTTVTVDGGVLDFNGHSDTIGNLIVKNGGQAKFAAIDNHATTVESGTLTATSIVCDSLTIGSASETSSGSDTPDLGGAILPGDDGDLNAVFAGVLPSSSVADGTKGSEYAASSGEDPAPVSATHAQAEPISASPVQKDPNSDGTNTDWFSAASAVALVPPTDSRVTPSVAMVSAGLIATQVAPALQLVSKPVMNGLKTAFGNSLPQISNGWLSALKAFQPRSIEDYFARFTSEKLLSNENEILLNASQDEKTASASDDQQPTIVPTAGQNARFAAVQSAIKAYQGRHSAQLFDFDALHQCHSRKQINQIAKAVDAVLTED